jgi:hypothetical protein
MLMFRLSSVAARAAFVGANTKACSRAIHAAKSLGDRCPCACTLCKHTSPSHVGPLSLTSHLQVWVCQSVVQAQRCDLRMGSAVMTFSFADV